MCPVDNTHLTRKPTCARLPLMAFQHIAPIARERFLKILQMAGFRPEEPEPKEEYDAWVEANEKETILREGTTIEEKPGDLRE